MDLKGRKSCNGPALILWASNWELHLIKIPVKIPVKLSPVKLDHPFFCRRPGIGPAYPDTVLSMQLGVDSKKKSLRKKKLLLILL